jgi:hypothetical protein
MSEEEKGIEEVESIVQAAKQRVNGITSMSHDDEEDDGELDPVKIRIGQNFSEEFEEIDLDKIVVGRPGDQDWFRIYSGEDYRVDVWILRIQPSGMICIIDEKVKPYLPKVQAATIHTWVTHRRRSGLWVVSYEDKYNPNAYTTTARKAVVLAKTRWVNVQNIWRQKKYVIRVHKKGFGEPSSPVLSFSKLLYRGFKDRVIKSLDHPLLEDLPRDSHEVTIEE